ncbi:WYL domain-containing protein [soil metagenome]
MGHNKEAFIRYRLIDQAVRNKFKPFPTLQDLVEKCETILGKSFSESTLQKDIYAMRFDEALGYLAPLDYSKRGGGYHYKDENYSITGIPLRDEEIASIEFAAGILSQFKEVGLLKQFESAIDKIMQTVDVSRSLEGQDISEIIQMENVSYFKGTEHLDFIVQSILQKKPMQYDYTNFYSGKTTHHVLHPYVLREYRNRWYVIGWHENIKKVRTFGLDRISNLELAKIKFYRDEKFKPKEFFKHSFGITVDTFKTEEIILSFESGPGNYIRTQKIHETQKVLIDNEEEFRISINVIPSHELHMQILSYGAEVEVIKPKKVRDEIIEALKLAAGNYK